MKIKIKHMEEIMDQNQNFSRENNLVSLNFVVFSALFGLFAFMPILGFPSLVTMGYEYNNMFEILQGSISSRVKTILIILLILWVFSIFVSITGLKTYINRNQYDKFYYVYKGFYFGTGVGIVFPVALVVAYFSIVGMAGKYESNMFEIISESESLFARAMGALIELLMIAGAIVAVYFFIYSMVTKLLKIKRVENETEHMKTISSDAGLLIMQIAILIAMLITSITFRKSVKEYGLGIWKIGMGANAWIVIIGIFLFIAMINVFALKSSDKRETKSGKPHVCSGFFTTLTVRKIVSIVVLLLCVYGMAVLNPINEKLHAKYVHAIRLDMTKEDVSSILGEPVTPYEEDKWVYYSGEFKAKYINYIQSVENLEKNGSLMDVMEMYEALAGTEHVATEIHFVENAVTLIIHDEKAVYSESEKERYRETTETSLYNSLGERVEAVFSVKTPDSNNLLMENVGDYYYTATLKNGGFITRELAVKPVLNYEEEAPYLSWSDGYSKYVAHINVNESILNEEGKYVIAEGTDRITAKHLEGLADKITSIEIPSSVTSIERDVFKGCSNIVEERNGIKYVGNWVVGCSSNVTLLELDSDIAGIADYAFAENNSIINVVIKGFDSLLIGFFSGVIHIPDGAFYHCSKLKNVILHENIYTIGQSAFENCTSLQRVEFGSGSITKLTLLDKIGDKAFKNCTSLSDFKQKNFSISSDFMEQFEFSYSIIIPGFVKYIGDEAFENCRTIKTLEIGHDMNYVGEGAFRKCEGIETLTARGAVKTLGKEVFDGCNNVSLAIVSNFYDSIASSPGPRSVEKTVKIVGEYFDYTYGWYCDTIIVSDEVKTIRLGNGLRGTPKNFIFENKSGWKAQGGKLFFPKKISENELSDNSSVLSTLRKYHYSTLVRN